MLDSLIQEQEFQIEDELSNYIRYMYGLQKSKDELQNLSKRWDMLALLSQLGTEGINVKQIKENFTKLSSDLINFLGNEKLNKYSNIMDSKASVAVDIVIRNLFERTADIGFLATDGEIRDFIKGFTSKYTDEYKEKSEKLRTRFEEYVAKYSVYYDVVLLSPTGMVLTRLDKTVKVEKSNDKIVKDTIHTNEEYFESFKYHDFIPNRKESLVYTYKVTESDDVDSEVIGVLALCFRFKDEMRSIFKNLVNPDTKECITLLDSKGRVVATSDEHHIPIGVELEMVLDESRKIVTFGGRDYMAKTKSTQGYQGFFGLGWYGHIMIPLDYAFEKEENLSLELSEEFLLSILQNGKAFSKELKNIPLQADSIQNNLNRAIYNGRLKQSSKVSSDRYFARSLLQEIGQSGATTNSIVSKSIANLTQTMVLGDSSATASLIVDIMDRNLYERANDCRWWALTPRFIEVLNKQSLLTDSEVKDMSKILEHINSLYTVYTLIFIYDTNGKVVAISNDEYKWLLNSRITNEWVSECLKINDTNQYTVSKFEPSALYNEENTYIYNAPILNENKVSVGGIGLVFDSTSQFKAMIDESTPDNKGKNPLDACFAVICDPEGRVVSSNEVSHEIGTTLDLDEKFFKLRNGESLDEIIEYKDRYYALGVVASQGYREYKSKNDTYSNDILTFYFSYICDADDIVIKENNKFFMGVSEQQTRKGDVGKTIDIASFYIGEKWLGIEAKDVLEVVDVKNIEDSVDLDSDKPYKGSLIFDNQLIGVVDCKKFVQNRADEKYEEVMIVRCGDSSEYVGILINKLSDIVESEEERLKMVDKALINNGTLIKGLISPRNTNDDKLLSVLDIKKLKDQIIEANKIEKSEKYA